LIKIKVSYTTQKDLDKVLKLLHPIIVSYKIAKSSTGRFKKAYIDIKE